MYIVVTMPELVAMNILLGKEGKKMPIEHKTGANKEAWSKSYEDPTRSDDITTHVLTAYFGAECLAKASAEDLQKACKDAEAECGGPCCPIYVKAVASKLTSDYKHSTTKDGKAGHYLLLKVNEDTRERMSDESHNFVEHFTTTDASMNGASRAIAYHCRAFAFGNGIRAGFSLKDGPEEAKAKMEALERGLRRAAARTEPAQFETHADLCFDLADKARAIDLAPALHRISDANSAASSLRAMISGNAGVLAIDALDDDSDVQNQRFLDEAIEELNGDDESGMNFGSSFEDEKRAFRGKLFATAKAPPIIARGGPALAFGCSCKNCQTPENKSCAEPMCVEAAGLAAGLEAPTEAEPPSRAAVQQRVQAVDADIERLFAQFPDVMESMKDDFYPKSAAEEAVVAAGMAAEACDDDELAEESGNSHDVATAYDAVTAQARAYNKLKPSGVADGYHPVCLIKMIATMLRVGLETELTRRMVCCSNIECLERMAMRSPGWNTRFQCCEHARAILAMRGAIPETEKTLYTLSNGSKRHGQFVGVLENVKALRYFAKHLPPAGGRHYQLSNADVDAMIAYLNVYAQWTQEQEKRSLTVALKMANAAHVHKLPIGNPQDLVDSVHEGAYSYLARVVGPWIKDVQLEYLTNRSAHTVTLKKMLHDAHPNAFDMTFLGMKLQHIDAIGVHGYDLDGKPVHPCKWWHNRPQGGVYDRYDSGRYAPTLQTMVPQDNPDQRFLLDGDVIMTYTEYEDGMLKYDSALRDNYTPAERREHDRKLEHGKLALILQDGHTRGGAFKDVLTSTDFCAGYLKTVKNDEGTAEACFEYCREGSADNRSDLSTVMRHICKGVAQPQKWILQQLRREQTNGMSGARHEVTRCRVPVPREGLFVFDGINMLDKNVHTKRRLTYALKAFGAKTFEEFDSAVADIKAKLNRQKEFATSVERHPLSHWSFVCGINAGKPTKQTVRDAANSFATEVPFDMAQQLRIAMREHINERIDDALDAFDELPGLGREASCISALAYNAQQWRVLAEVNSSVLRQTDAIREQAREQRLQKAAEVERASRALDAIESDEFVVAVMEPFCEAQVAECKRVEFLVLQASQASQCRADAVESALEASRAVLAVRSRATDNTIIHRVADALADDLSKPAKLGGLRSLRGPSVCAVLSKKERLDPTQPDSPFVSVPFNASRALKILSDYEEADEDAKARTWAQREAALNEILYEVEVSFEDPNEFANAYDGISRNAPAWEPCAVVLMDVYDIAKKVTEDTITNNDGMRRSKPSRNAKNYERRALGLINAMRIAPVYADSLLKFYPSGNLGVKTAKLTQYNRGAVNSKKQYELAYEAMQGDTRADPSKQLADYAKDAKENAYGHRPLYASRMLFDNSDRAPTTAVYDATGLDPRAEAVPTATLAGAGAHSERARATRLRPPLAHVYGTVGDYVFRVPARAGPALGVAAEDDLENAHAYHGPMAAAVDALDKLLSDGYDAQWFEEILERADKYCCWKAYPKPGEGPLINQLRGEKLAQLRGALERVALWMRQHPALPSDLRPGSDDEAALLELWESLSLVLEAYNPFCTPNRTREVHTWHPHAYVQVGDALVPNTALGELHAPLPSPWTLPTVREDVAWAMRIAPAARRIAVFVDNVLHATDSRKRLEQRERQRDERTEKRENALDKATVERVAAAAAIRKHVLDAAVEQLAELKINTPDRVGVAGTLGAYRECMARDIKRARLMSYGGDGDSDRVMVGPYAGFTNAQVSEITTHLAEADMSGAEFIFHPRAFGDANWDKASTLELRKLDYARARVALAFQRLERQAAAHDFEQARLTGKLTSGQIKAHEELQARLQRRDEARRRIQDNFNLSQASASKNGGRTATKDPRVLKRHTGGGGGGAAKRTEHEINLQILKQSETLDPANEDIKREIADLEGVIAGAAMPKSVESLLGQQVPVRYIAAIREGRLQIDDVETVHARFEWPISDLLANAGNLPSDAQKTLRDEVARGGDGCLKFTVKHQQVCLAASDARKAKAEAAHAAALQKTLTFLRDSPNDLTAEAAERRRELDPAEHPSAGKRQRTRDGPTFEAFLDERMGGSARVYSKDFEDRAHWMAIADNQSVASAYARGLAEQQLGEWERACNDSASRTSEILARQVHAFHGADAADDDEDGPRRWRAYEQRIEVKDGEHSKWNGKGLA